MRLPALLLALAAAGVLLPATAVAQCPDGGTPPCSRPRPAARPIDPNRVAVLPFRVATADTLLGEGFAELLASEFTGEGGPRSVDMATTLTSWRRAGGGLRTPLTQDAAARVARELGAGLLVQGAIVGMGGRVTVTASLLDATTGTPRGTPSRAVGRVDSLDVLLGQVANPMFGQGERRRTAAFSRFASSTTATRAYMEGLTLLRRGFWERAAASFEASVAADSTFAPAVYQRWLLTAVTGFNGATWRPRVWEVRDKLGPRERAIVDGYGIDPRATRTAAQNIAARRRTADQLGDSPEAWFFYGDASYHFGLAAFPPDSVLPIASAAFARAAAVDSQTTYLFHLMEISARNHDTTLMRALWHGYEHLGGEETWARGWVTAGLLGDAALLERLRRKGPDSGATIVSALSLLLGGGPGVPVPAALIDEGARRLRASLSPEVQGQAAYVQWVIHRAQGRPAAAERAIVGQDSRVFRLPFIRYAFLTGDTAVDLALLRTKAMSPARDSIEEGRRLCGWALVQATRGAFDSVPDMRGYPNEARCEAIVTITTAFQRKQQTDSMVSVLDGLLHSIHYSTFRGYEHRLLSRMYESRGDIPRALEALRYYPRDYQGSYAAPTARETGRLALMAGDTTLAVRSYEYFLSLRAEAEPPYVAERDSVRAILQKLPRRWTNGPSQ